MKNSPFGFGERIDLNDAVLSVGVKNMLAVRTPLEVTDVGVVVLGDLDRLATGGDIVEVDLGLPCSVTYEARCTFRQDSSRRCARSSQGSW